MRDRREEGRIRLHEQSVVRDEAQERVVGPVPERHDATEGHIPSARERDFGEADAAGIAVQHASHAIPGRIAHHVTRIVLGIARMDDDRPVEFTRECKLRRKCLALAVAGGVVVVVVEATLPDCHRPRSDVLANLGDVARCIEATGIMRMYARCVEAEPRVRGRQECGALRRGHRLANAHDGLGTALSCAGDDILAIRVERRIREVRMAVDERNQRVRAATGGRVPAGLTGATGAGAREGARSFPRDRGHLRSIQSNVGPAM